jgi:glycosyltransferase involved in cell wall biosynthesis
VEDYSITKNKRLAGRKRGLEFNFIFPKFKLLSGAERLILKLAEYVVKEGHSSVLICHNFHQSCYSLLYPGVKLIESKKRLEYFRNHFLNAPFDYLRTISLKKYLRNSADILCFFGPSLPLLWYIKALTRLKRHCFYFCYEPPRFIYKDRDEIIFRMGFIGSLAKPFFNLYKVVDRRIINRADAILVTSQFDQQLVQDAYNKVSFIITPGVDVQTSSDEANEFALPDIYGLQQNSKIILAVNFLHPRKRIDLLIKAMPSILEKIPQTKALIVGNGPEKERLEVLSKELKLDKDIIFCGFVSEADLPLYYKSADIYVHTGKDETFGLSVIEALAYGKPVVAVNEGGPRETIVHEKSGYLIEANPQALAEKAIVLLQSPEKAHQMGSFGRDFIAKNYSWKKGAQELIELSNDFLMNKRR